jgi:hypothetical protein
VDVDGRRFDDVHGAGWRLVTDGACGSLAPDLVDWLVSIDGAVVAVGDGAPDLTAWFATHDVHWALQRPDFHLYGTAADVAGAAALVDRLRTDLGSTR